MPLLDFFDKYSKPPVEEITCKGLDTYLDNISLIAYFGEQEDDAYKTIMFPLGHDGADY